MHQEFLRKTDTLVPPDFLIIMSEKDVYGIEVGTEKEKQSGFFSLVTNIPMATLDTENSRTSDRCPICKRWIPFCPKVIEDFSNLNKKFPRKPEIRCLKDCKKFSEDEISQGKCPYTKYSRPKAKKLEYAKIEHATGKHYHYACVLANIRLKEKELIIRSKDKIALKTHYPYCAGLETLFR